MIRGAAVAGSFYPADGAALKAMTTKMLAAAVAPPAKGIHSFVAPHAGYTYSGSVAACAYRLVALQAQEKKIDTYVVIGPNHTGMGEPLAVSMQDWRTPLGLVKNDAELSKRIIAESHNISADEEAHAEEHSIEVQLPFLQSVVKEPRCVFICMGDQGLLASKILQDAVEKAASKLERSIAVIASSDLDHYEPAETAKRKDAPAVKELERVDGRAFWESIRKSGDSACGFGPITVSAMFARDRGASRGLLLKYANSGDITGDYKSVVSYASFAFCD